MIIGLWEKQELNKIESGTYQLDKNTVVEATFYFIREASYQEWLNYRTEQGTLLDIDNEEIGYYYEVSTD